MITTRADFNYEPYNIPNLDKVGGNFDIFRADQEAVILKSLLGISLYQDFINGIAEDYPEQKWVDLNAGKTYQVDGLTYEWAGFLGRNGALVPAIYAEWLRATYDNHTGVGITVSRVENAEKISPSLRISRAQTNFKNLVGWQAKNGFAANFKNTLYGFLIINAVDYPNLVWTDPGSINIFDL